MSTLWKRAIATTTIALVAGFGITACSSGGTTTPESTKSTTDTQQSAPKAGSAMTADDFTQRMNDAQLKAGSAHFTQMLTVAGAGEMKMNGEMKIGDDPSKTSMQFAGDMGGMQMEMRVVEGVTYMKMGELTQNKFAQMGDGSPFDGMAASGDLSAQLKLFKEALVDFAQDGSESIDGVEAKRYVLTLDTKKVLASSAEEVPAEALDKIGDTLTYEIFVGPDDLPRKIAMDMAGVPTVMTFSKWGEPVDIQVPSAEEITDQPLPF
ncbi:MAG: hypothetical protein WA971_12130 [Microbacterium sp.]